MNRLKIVISKMIQRFVLIICLMQGDALFAIDSVEVSMDSLPELDNITVIGHGLNPMKMPLKVDTVGQRVIEQAMECNILDVLDGKQGLRKKVDCSVCNTAQIQFIGLKGAYTQILYDGIPSYSGLGMIYGIEQIPMTNIDRIEIVKGVGHVKYGNNAIAGVINIVPKKIPPAPTVHLKMNYGHHNEQNYSTAFSARVRNTGIQASFNRNTSPMINMNDDDMNDVAEFERHAFTTRLTQTIREHIELSGNVSVSSEDRFGGTETSSRRWIGQFQPESTWVSANGNIIHQPLIYQEYVQSKRVSYEGGMKLILTEKLLHELRISFLEHYQNSYYGYLNLEAKQHILHIENDFHYTSKCHDLLAGIAYNFDGFTDNRSFGSHNYHVPSVYIQESYKPSEDWDIMGGIRYDYHNIHGSILSPRLGLRFGGFDHFVFRVNGGRGFRTFNLFSENHAATTSDVYYLLPIDDLRAERSWSVLVNAEFSIQNKIFGIACDLSAYHTRIKDYIQPYYLPKYTVDGRQMVKYCNLDGNTIAQGLEFTGSLLLPGGFSIDIGGNLLDNYSTSRSNYGTIYYSPDYMANGQIVWRSERIGMEINLNGNRVGPQKLREVRFGPVLVLSERTSPSYMLFNLQIEQDFKPFTFTIAVRNFTDFYQAKKEQIFFSKGWYYQTTSVWGPMKGRTFYFGIRFNNSFNISK